MFDISGLTVTRITRDDAVAMRELQALLERCSDYYELVEGRPAPPTAATDEFDLPPEYSRDDIFVLGFREGDDLIAEMSLVRNSPKPTEWWMALFVVQPASRSRGLGTRICEAKFQWIASMGGTTIVMAVDEENPRGQRFWRSLGLIETARRDYTAPTGMQRRVIIMRRALTPTR
ncbi:MAG: GNAT family N-acetyltransferase [Acidobacteriota bacterium]|nr:GNAT family N-acetyltransferase [Acidobacteriota bacterium]